jgi:endo-1,3-1,4-beta-glycanase ExoK
MKRFILLLRFLAGAGGATLAAVLLLPQTVAVALPGPPDSPLGRDLRPAPNTSASSKTDQPANSNSRGGKPGGGGGGGSGATGWQDDFSGTSLDTSRWTNAEERAPGYIPGNHQGYYEPSNVSVQNGYLVIRLTQFNGPVDGLDGVVSLGGLVYTDETFRYGTYQWRARMSSTSASPGGTGSPVSGSVSAGFNYINNSETEIDFEFSGHLPGWLWMVNWHNTNPSTGPFESQQTYSSIPLSDITSAFHTYKFVWERRKITFYVDDVYVTDHVTNVPRAPARFMINHWGTNNPFWGGPATLGTTRFYYVDWASYTP